MNQTIWQVNKNEKIDIKFDDLSFWESMQIIFYIRQKKIILYDIPMYDFFEDVQIKLKRVLNNELCIEGKLEDNIGSIYNDFMHFIGGKDDQGIDTRDIYFSWPGHKYLFETNIKTLELPLAVWLYNDEDGKIVLEVTPLYLCDHKECDESEQVESYEDFKKEYKPILKRVIPRDVAEKWMLQAKQLHEQMLENEKE